MLQDFTKLQKCELVLIFYLCVHILYYADDVTTYTTLIGDVQEVQDDSSDFELPESIIA